MVHENPDFSKSTGSGVVPNVPNGLCFTKESFTHAKFSVDELLQQLRSSNAVPLEVLRDDLGVYLKVLRSAMIELINRDYADFVNLSSNLVGLDKRIETLQEPLLVIKEEVMNLKNSLDDSYQQLSEALQQRQEIREKKAVLECLLKIPCSLEHIEKLLQNLSTSSEVDEEFGVRGNVMERAANEFNHLQHYVAKCKDSALVAQLLKRIDVVNQELMLRLEDALLHSIESFDDAMLKNTLRTYALLDKCSAAENLVSSKIIKPNVDTIINENALRMEPRDLPGILASLKKFIRQNLKGTLDATTSADGVEGFNFVVNALWPPFSQCLLEMTSIFAPGNPDLLQNRYRATMEFIEYLEVLSGSVSSAQALRNHSNYQNLMSRWNLPVYFQIRFQDIAGNLETSLARIFSEQQHGESGAIFKLAVSSVLWKSMNDCYATDIYLPSLAHRFWKLTLQLMARFCSRVGLVLQEEMKKSGSTALMHPSMSTAQLTDLDNTVAGSSLSHSTSMPRLPSTSGSTGLHNYVHLYSDICQLLEQLPSLWSVIEQHFHDIGVENTTTFHGVFKHSAEKLSLLLPKISDLITADLQSQCSVHLRNVTDIPRLYRRTNREAPIKSCLYVTQLLAPVKEFEASIRTTVEGSVLEQWIRSIIVAVTAQYLAAVSDVLTSVQKTEESLKRLRKARAPASGGTETSSSGISDDDRIRMQLVLDVEAFLQQVDLFVPRDTLSECQELLNVVESARR